MSFVVNPADREKINGKYELFEKIGEGQTSNVARARYKSGEVERDVVVKIPKYAF